MNIVFLVEERSMEVVLEGVLPSILPDNVGYTIVKHSGKSNLKKSIPRKIKGWNIPDTYFVIIIDQDSNDCLKLKDEIKSLCPPEHAKNDVLIRIVCHELEAWYFGDLGAVSEAYGLDLTKLEQKRKYSVPDSIENPKDELKKLIPQHEQISGARKIAPLMDINNNRSKSFNVLLDGIRRILQKGMDG